MNNTRYFFLCILVLLYVDVAAAVTSQELVFESHGVQLSGTLFIPKGFSPAAAIVLVHGSGSQERNSGLAKWLASNGFAALTYDKRGVGSSGGVYEGQDNTSSLNLDLLAADAAAAYRALQSHSSMSDLPIGYAGISQAGWIIPIAATRSSDVAFMVLWSAPVTKVSEELIFSADAAEDEEVAKQQRTYAQRISADDTDPRDSLVQLDIPGIWLFGDMDTSTPVSLSIERLDGLIAEGHEFEYQTFSGYGHDVQSFDDPRNEAAINWIKERVIYLEDYSG